MSSTDPFSPPKRAALRTEIEQQGLLADKFLNSDADVATFGLNLACAWPFPQPWKEAHGKLSEALRAFEPWLYLYPFAATHITLATFVTFTRHVRPTENDRRQMEGLAERIIATVNPTLRDTKAFELQPQLPVLARAAGILPFQNPDGEVDRLRQSVLAAVQRNEALHDELDARGLGIPGIIHSTLMRFVSPPVELDDFLGQFDAATDAVKFPPLRIGEVFLTSETRPYMRGGQVLHTFKLSDV